jgi:hypothetical protein
MLEQLLEKFPSDELIGLVLGGLAVSGGFLVAIIAIIGGVWHNLRLTALKQDMVAHGMSAEEIRTVLEAGTRRSRCSRQTQGPTAVA